MLTFGKTICFNKKSIRRPASKMIKLLKQKLKSFLGFREHCSQFSLEKKMFQIKKIQTKKHNKAGTFLAKIRKLYCNRK